MPAARMSRPRAVFLAAALRAAPVLVLLAGGCVEPAGPTAPPGERTAWPAHPFLLFDRSETPALARRRTADALLEECWARTDRLARGPDSAAGWAGQLEARALLWQVTGEQQAARSAIALMRSVLERTDPADFFRRTDVLRQGESLRALALGWDWLHDNMTPAEQREILAALERWCRAGMEYHDAQWWRDASYNVGAVPFGGLGLLATAIRPDSDDPGATACFREAARRIGQNFFPTSWKPSGICWEGPNYAIVGLRHVAPFAEALRRTGHDDLLGRSGALHAMDYLMYQWLPSGGCAPIGDNTGYGARTFAAEYLLGLSRTRDPAALWTWRTFTDRRRLDPVMTFLWYPPDVRPESPGRLGRMTSRYFEVTANRAGYVFSRTGWDDPDAAFFAFATRFEKSNHQHYDMNSVLLGAFGTLFATHRCLYPYSHPHQGVDFEHNLVVVDGGGWPANDSGNSCGDDNSTDGLLVGLVLGGFADYVRGDAKWSFRDNTVPNSDPAVRAERTCLFVKAGPGPYLLAVDDVQYRQDRRKYDWLWHAPDLPVAGSGTLDDPVTITASGGRCAIRFLAPPEPLVTVEPAEELSRSRQAPLKRITVTQTGIRVRYAAVATLEKAGTGSPTVARADVQCQNPSAAGATVVFTDGTTDHLTWQSEEQRVQAGSDLVCGRLRTDGLTALVRVKDGRITGYVLGEGTYLRWGPAELVRASGPVCVSAGPEDVRAEGRRRAREGLPAEMPASIRTLRPWE